MVTNDNSLIAFKCIAGFISDVNSVSGEKLKSIKMYNHLLEKTTLTHEKAIEKNTQIFSDFCKENREAIQENSLEKFKSNIIKYSENVVIDIVEIFEKTDSKSHEQIWKHLLTISAVVDPTGNAKKILKEMAVKNKSIASESDFIGSMIDKIEKNIDKDVKDPMEAVQNIMSSGVFNEIIEGMGKGLQDGSLDIGNMINSVQKMSGSDEGSQGNFDLSQIMNMVGPLMGGLGAMNQNGSSTPSLPPSILEDMKNLKMDKKKD